MPSAPGSLFPANEKIAIFGSSSNIGGIVSLHVSFKYAFVLLNISFRLQLSVLLGAAKK